MDARRRAAFDELAEAAKYLPTDKIKELAGLARKYYDQMSMVQKAELLAAQVRNHLPEAASVGFQSLLDFVEQIGAKPADATRLWRILVVWVAGLGVMPGTAAQATEIKKTKITVEVVRRAASQHQTDHTGMSPHLYWLLNAWNKCL